MKLRRNTETPAIVDDRPRMIVRRTKGAMTVGGNERSAPEPPPRTIVRRTARIGVQPVAEVNRKRSIKPPSLPAAMGWRPGWRFYLSAASAIVLAVAGATGYWLWQSPYFQVQEISVRGNTLVPTEAIVAAADLDGERMVTLDLGATRNSLYELTLIKSAKIERQWPHGISITIVEREAWGTWEQSGVAYTIDREGVVLGTMPAPDGSPIIRSSQEGSRVQGDRVDYQAVDAAAEIYADLPKTLGADVSEIAYVPNKGLQVTTSDGDTAIFGDSSSITYKLEVWAAMAERARAEQIPYTTIDLRFGNRPVLQ